MSALKQTLDITGGHYAIRTHGNEEYVCCRGIHLIQLVCCEKDMNSLPFSSELISLFLVSLKNYYLLLLTLNPRK